MTATLEKKKALYSSCVCSCRSSRLDFRLLVLFYLLLSLRLPFPFGLLFSAIPPFFFFFFFFFFNKPLSARPSLTRPPRPTFTFQVFWTLAVDALRGSRSLVRHTRSAPATCLCAPVSPVSHARANFIVYTIDVNWSSVNLMLGLTTLTGLFFY